MPTFKWSELKHEAIDGEYSPVRAPVYRGDKIEVARAQDYTTINCKDIVPGFSVYHAAWEK